MSLSSLASRCSSLAGYCVCACLLIICLAGGIVIYPVPSASAASPLVDLNILFQAARSPKKAVPLDLNSYRNTYQNPEALPEDLRPLWPLYSFLLGEVSLLQGDAVPARNLYRALVEWAATDPYQDGWGASGLVSVALWRWLDLTRNDPQLSFQDRAAQLEIIAKIWEEHPRLVQGMFSSLPFLLALPQLQEEILRHLTSLAWSLKRHAEAQRYFIDYLGVARSGKLNPTEKALLRDAVETGVLSEERVALFLARRLRQVGEFPDAKHWFQQARKSEEPEVEAAACFELAQLEHRRGKKCGTREMFGWLEKAILNASDPDVVQNARFLLAKIYRREGCKRHDIERFKGELHRILKDYPRGRRADDALHQLALYYFERYCDLGQEADLQEGLRLYERLHKDFPDRPDYLDSSYFRPAIFLYSRGESDPNKLQQACTLLKKLIRQRPQGPMQLAALFWLGRMSAKLGREEEAKKHFHEIIATRPFDYYAIRARMHLNIGPQASHELNLDEATTAALRQDFLDSQNVYIPLSGTSPYHQRLRGALQSGLYHQAFRSHIDAKKRFFPAKRLETIAISELDKARMIPDVAVLLSLRLDAQAAVNRPYNIDNLLEVAHVLSNFNSQTWPYGDWALAIYLTGGMNKPLEVRNAIQRDKRYLAVAYPTPFKPLIQEYSSNEVPAAFISAIIRHESAFSPTAMSPGGALGLFQFLRSTFNGLNRDWGLLRKMRKKSATEFLLDPNCSIYLGARWFRQRLLPRQEHNYAWALMEHNAGFGAVNAWKKKWKKVKKDDDLEYMLEAVRFSRTRGFLRRVLTSFWIMQASGLYQKE